MNFVDEVYLGNSILDWLIAAGTTLLVFVFLVLLKKVLARRLHKLAKSTATDIDDLIVDLLNKTKPLVLLAVAVFAGSFVLTLPERVSALIARITTLTLLLQGGIWGSALLVYLIAKNVNQRTSDDPASATTMAAMGFLGKLVIWSVILLLGLENLGFDITALIAGLGIGGIAIALALQNILGDLFASLSIVLDKPFVIGDFIIVDDMLGTVEHVGLKTTRVKSLSGEQLVFANADLLKSRIRNYKRMVERRVVFSLGVTYQTSHERLKGIGSILGEIVGAETETRFDRAHFKGYGDFALTFEVVYYVLSPDYTLFMDIQERINLEVYRRFEQEGIEFAYPTQTVHLYSQTVVQPPQQTV